MLTEMEDDMRVLDNEQFNKITSLDLLDFIYILRILSNVDRI